MKIIIDTKKIERNRKIGSYTLLGGMVVLFGGLFISISQIATGFQDPANPPPNAEMMLNYATIAMFVGLLLTEISMYFNNRWGRKPTIEEKVSLGLKGLDDRYTLYHHRGPVPSLLVGPAGIWVLVTLYQRGVVTFEPWPLPASRGELVHQNLLPGRHRPAGDGSPRARWTT